jgi:hypothetical protein
MTGFSRGHRIVRRLMLRDIEANIFAGEIFLQFCGDRHNSLPRQPARSFWDGRRTIIGGRIMARGFMSDVLEFYRFAGLPAIAVPIGYPQRT